MLGGRELQIIAESDELTHGHIAHFRDVLPAHGDGERLFFQTFPLAVGAVGSAHIALDIPLDAIRTRLIVSSLQVVDKALPHALIGVVEGLGVVFELDRLPLAPIHQKIVDLFGELFDGRIHGKSVAAGERGEIHLRDGGGVEVPPADADGALAQRLRLVGADEVGVDELAEAEARTRRAGAPRRVEGEEAGLDLLDGDVAVGAGVARGIEGLLPLPVDDDEPVGKL